MFNQDTQKHENEENSCQKFNRLKKEYEESEAERARERKDNRSTRLNRATEKELSEKIDDLKKRDEVKFGFGNGRLKTTSDDIEINEKLRLIEKYKEDELNRINAIGENLKRIDGHNEDLSKSEVSIISHSDKVQCDDAIFNHSYSSIMLKNMDAYDGPNKEIIRWAPPFFNLMCGILNDKITDWHTKILISSSLGYFVLDDDVIPDDGDNGYIDDLL